MRAGIVAFFAMAYIIAVNSSIVADSGGPCVCNGGPDDPICLANEEYDLCTAVVKRDMVTATAAISALTSFFMGLFANLYGAWPSLSGSHQDADLVKGPSPWLPAWD